MEWTVGFISLEIIEMYELMDFWYIKSWICNVVNLSITTVQETGADFALNI